ncbi:PH domain-containing protein [Caballeronia sordidicola]|uniref:PH domain-containing protein n=1 Tax=Caballeronia sordidicola TaxID=196367 RepID=UPI000B788A81|nr:PH domain-containing protein [Caballeronia sordidicola]
MKRTDHDFRPNVRAIAIPLSIDQPTVVEFHGSPSWAVNLPFYLKCALALIVGLVVVWESAAWPTLIPFFLLIAGAVGIAIAIGLRAATTAQTQIVIDSVRMTMRYGILSRRVASVEMYRVQNVECVSIWWERLMGFGTLVVESSDVNHPRWTLRGMPDVEALREWMNLAAIARRDAKGIREVNMGRV